MNQETREKILILVSGVRSSLDNKVVMNDSSTKPSAFIIKTFINRVYPDIKVEIIHSNSDWSRYDENIFFVRKHIYTPKKSCAVFLCANAFTHKKLYIFLV